MGAYAITSPTDTLRTKKRIRKQHNDAGDGHDIARHMLGQTVAAAMSRDDFE